MICHERYHVYLHLCVYQHGLQVVPIGRPIGTPDASALREKIRFFIFGARKSLSACTGHTAGCMGRAGGGGSGSGVRAPDG